MAKVAHIKDSEIVIGDILDLSPGDRVSGRLDVPGYGPTYYAGVFTGWSPRGRAIVRFDYPLPVRSRAWGPDGYAFYEGKLLSHAFRWDAEINKIKGAGHDQAKR